MNLLTISLRTIANSVAIHSYFLGNIVYTSLPLIFIRYDCCASSLQIVNNFIDSVQSIWLFRRNGDQFQQFKFVNVVSGDCLCFVVLFELDAICILNLLFCNFVVVRDTNHMLPYLWFEKCHGLKEESPKVQQRLGYI